MDKKSKTEKKIYQKWWSWLIIVLMIIISIYFIYNDEIKAKKLGIDVQYLKNPKYCQVNEDCVVDRCGVINKYNFEYDYKRSKVVCPSDFCGGKCENNICIPQKCEENS